ncbi:molybdopterin-dependent oxidoreductase [Wukongibacter sp. M2B1]|uniref:molybdopterin-dependent oxidoreductase n=1 Tax=Wukongibacter sp. M2B1 TaxID=3088895 RepID=UPI003D79A58F
MKSKIALVIIVLTLIVGVTAFINLKSVEVKKDLEENSKFVIKENGEEVVVLNMKEISSLGEKDFKANFKKNGKEAVSFNYTGVPFKNILNKYNISLDDKSAIIFTAIDGYTVAVEIEKILEDNNVYLTYMKEGELLGNKENGGSGPYQMIISKDPFSQYWCKFAIEADVQ